MLRGHDLATGYAAVLVASVIIVFAQPHGVASRLVLESSTNTQNLRTQPLLVLFVSAFVVSSPWGLWILPFLVWGFGAAQRWLGRAATVLVAAFGHVFATVFVGVLINAGIAHHQLSRSIAREPDVGASYALAALVGVMVFRLTPAARGKVSVVVTAGLTGHLVLSQTFTELGHVVAWVIGLTMGFVGSRIAGARYATGRGAFREPVG